MGTLIGLKSRTSYVLGNPIARGGEGTVYEVHGNPAKVIKIYSRLMDKVREEKLAELMKVYRPTLAAVSAWPEEVVADGSKPVGFVMPAVRGGRPLHCYITPSDRHRYAPGATYGALVAVAANLARAVMNFHQAGVVLSDINFSNFLVLPNGTVRIIDCDSVQIGSKAKFRATVAMEEFIPPELQGTRVAENARTPDHDNFGLSVLIFLLLIQGRHPFSGSGGMPMGEAIWQRLHPFYKTHPDRTCPFCAMGLKAAEVLSADLIALFTASFNGGGTFSKYRPTAAQWVSALDAFAKSMIVCKANPAHGYTQANKACPWCRLETEGKPALFAPTPRSKLPPPPKKGLLASLFG